MAKKPATSGGIRDDAEYEVKLKRPIQVARGTWARVGTSLKMKGKKLREHLGDVDGYEEISS
jgi:hypothetical protein